MQLNKQCKAKQLTSLAQKVDGSEKERKKEIEDLHSKHAGNREVLSFICTSPFKFFWHLYD